MQPQIDLGNDAERAFAANHQMGEVVARAAFAHAPAGLDQPPVGKCNLEPQHVLPDRAVAHGRRAARARCAHTAQRTDAAGIDGKEQSLVAQMLVQLLARDARLHPAIHVGGVHRHDRRHLAHVDADAAAHGRHMTLKRRAGAERDGRYAIRMAQAQQPRDLRARVDECHRVGLHGRLCVLAMAMLLTYRGTGGDAVAQKRRGLGQYGPDGGLHCLVPLV